MKKIKGYKAFKRDADGKLFTDPKARNYFEVGNTYSIDNDKIIELCENGFHFCKELNRIFDFYIFSQSIAYCEVEGLFENDLRDIDEDSNKICTRSIKIIKKLNFDEVLEIIKTELKNTGESVSESEHYQNVIAICYSKYIRESSAIRNSLFVEGSSAVVKGQAINNSYVIKECKNINDCQAVYGSNSIIHSKVINDSFLVYNSKVIDHSKFIINSENIFYSSEVVKSANVSHSNYIKKSANIYYSDYIKDSFLINYSHYILDCHNLENCLFCYRLHNKVSYIFNKKVSELRFEEIKRRLQCILSDKKWHLKFTNKKKLQDRYNYDNCTLYDFVVYDAKEHFENFPQEAIDYLKLLPEFNAKIFKAITNIDVENEK